MKFCLFLWLLLFSMTAKTQTDAITVTGTRVERPSMEVPASIDRVEDEDIRFARPQINLSESLGRVPGIVVQNRQNYAQDLQISSRGFGGRSTFGIRGLRLIADGIPASFPDGQGQVSHFDLGSAQSIEVLRGPFAVMYGNASGGVINVVTESGASYGEGKTALASGNGEILRHHGWQNVAEQRTPAQPPRNQGDRGEGVPGDGAGSREAHPPISRRGQALSREAWALHLGSPRLHAQNRALTPPDKQSGSGAPQASWGPSGNWPRRRHLPGFPA